MRMPDLTHQQGGLFTRAQAVSAGIAYSTIRRAITEGRVTEVMPGVLALPGAADTPRQRVRALSLATDTVVSHWSAAIVLALDHRHPCLHAGNVVPARTPLHVTSVTGKRVRGGGIHVHRSTLEPSDIRIVDGIRLTSVQRTCVDLICFLPREDARGLAYRARQQGWLDRRDVDRALELRRGWRGISTLRDLSQVFDGDAHSVAEAMLVEILRTIPALVWELNAPVVCRSGARYVVDVLVRALGLVIEVDGRAFHTRERFVGDRRRQNDLVADGWTILRFTWDDLVHQRSTVREVIVTTMARLASAGSRPHTA